MERYKILVVDDEEEIRLAVTELLEHENYEVVSAANGNRALEMIDDTFDLIILDVMMPDKDGISMCIDIRKKYVIPILFLTAKNTEYDKCVGFSVGGDDYLEKPFSKIELLARVSSLKKYVIPILFLTAKNTEYDKCVGFSVGGDDYLEKPFSKIELLARVSSLLRRYRVYQQKSPAKTDRLIRRKDLKIDQESTRVFKGENEIFLTNTEYKLLLLLVKNPNKIFTLEMTNTEYKLLLLLVKNPNKIFTLEMIYEQVWQETYDYSVNASIMVHIRNLRKKLGDTIQGGKYIKNIWGKRHMIILSTLRSWYIFGICGKN